MRVRNRKGAGEMLAENAHIVVENPADFKGRWSERFGNNHPIHIEVGCGKGAFITRAISKVLKDSRFLMSVKSMKIKEI